MQSETWKRIRIYTAVYEDYSVDVFKARKALCEFMTRGRYVLEDDSEEEASAAYPADIARAVKGGGIVYMYEPGNSDWKYRFEPYPHWLVLEPAGLPRERRQRRLTATRKILSWRRRPSIKE